MQPLAACFGSPPLPPFSKPDRFLLFHLLFGVGEKEEGEEEEEYVLRRPRKEKVSPAKKKKKEETHDGTTLLLQPRFSFFLPSKHPRLPLAVMLPTCLHRVGGKRFGDSFRLFFKHCNFLQNKYRKYMCINSVFC